MKRRCLGDRTSLALMFAIAAATAAGCAPKEDHVVFVTRTSLGVDVDTEPPAASIGYDRIEGYLGPRTSDGSVPPVLASIQSSGGAFNSDVRQTYATGAAAMTVAGGIAGVDQPVPQNVDVLNGKPKLMFFGTSSTVGLKVASGAAGPSSVTFGYKRKEVSVIPLARIGGTDDEPKYRYLSVIAGIDTTADAEQASGAKLTNAQFFATGRAAELFGRSKMVQAAFRDRSKEALNAFDTSETRQRIAAGGVLACYAGLFPDQRPQAWADAQQKELLKPEQEKGQPAPAPDEVLKLLTALNDPAGKDEAAARKTAGQASNLYATYIAQPSGFTPDRETRLEQHREAVCKLANG